MYPGFLLPPAAAATIPSTCKLGLDGEVGKLARFTCDSHSDRLLTICIAIASSRRRSIRSEGSISAIFRISIIPYAGVRVRHCRIIERARMKNKEGGLTFPNLLA
jgi:hypothetical protein